MGIRELSTLNCKLWVFPLLAAIIYLGHSAILSTSESFHKKRFQRYVGHDWSGFYHAKALVSALKLASDDPLPYWQGVEKRLVDGQFITEGKPGWILSRALFFFVFGNDFSEPDFKHDTGDNFKAFRLEYYFYLFCQLICALFIFLIGRELFSSAAGIFASLIFSLSTYAAFFIAFKNYILPSCVPFLVGVYVHLRSFRKPEGAFFPFLMGLCFGVAIFMNPRLVFIAPFIALLDIFRYANWPASKLRWMPTAKRSVLIVVGVVIIPCLYDLLICVLFGRPVFNLAHPDMYGERSWFFFLDAFNYGKLYIEKPVNLSWPTYFFHYLWHVEGPIMMILGILSMICLTGYLIILVRKRAFLTSVDKFESREFYAVALVFLIGPIQILLWTIWCEFTASVYNGRAFFFGYLGVILATGKLMDLTLTYLKGRRIYCQIFFVVMAVFLLYEFGSIVNMYRVLDGERWFATWSRSLDDRSAVFYDKFGCDFHLEKDVVSRQHQISSLDQASLLFSSKDSTARFLVTPFRLKFSERGDVSFVFNPYQLFNAWALKHEKIGYEKIMRPKGRDKYCAVVHKIETIRNETKRNVDNQDNNLKEISIAGISISKAGLIASWFRIFSFLYRYAE